MVIFCPYCHNVLSNNVWCSYCNKNIDMNEVQIMHIKKNIKTLFKILFVVILLFLILYFICYLQDQSFNKCVDINGGHSDCGLGTLCDSDCMPPLYFTMTFVLVAYSFFAITSCLVLSSTLLFNIIKYFVLNKKMKNSN